MRNIVVNGVRVTVGTLTEVQELGIANKCYRLPFSLVIANSRLTKGELFKMAGYDMEKIDFAIPEDWCKHGYDPDDWVWSYEGSSIGGRPVHISEAKTRALEAILAVLTANDTELHTIRIEVKGGCVQDVDGLPPGWDYEVVDYDICSECGGGAVDARHG